MWNVTIMNHCPCGYTSMILWCRGFRTVMVVNNSYILAKRKEKEKGCALFSIASSLFTASPRLGWLYTDHQNEREKRKRSPPYEVIVASFRSSRGSYNASSSLLRPSLLLFLDLAGCAPAIKMKERRGKGCRHIRSSPPPKAHSTHLLYCFIPLCRFSLIGLAVHWSSE
ncbi:hypothetical protein Nepgr_003270 [Nepenthes gracilis]|uniref:Uncharacterized protein n=1 Tax=Nepenthes gracilis TaxID=150966 RepID=A0AAD3RZ67_NEPGR|nr:hypothetical protein Nepgr_003270 [Nepenthes gracilis]